MAEKKISSKYFKNTETGSASFNNLFKEFYCAECRTVICFGPGMSTSTYAYKFQKNNTIHFCCSYSCMNKQEAKGNFKRKVYF